MDKKTEAKNTKTITDTIWDFFADVKLAIVVFALIGLTSIVGTIIEQDAAPEKNIQIIGKMFGQGSAVTIYNILESLGFMDMYRSWWFMSLLGLFAANLLICSIDRLPGVWKIASKPIKPLEDENFSSAGIKREFTIRGGPDKAKQAVLNAIKAAGFKPLENKEPKGNQYYAEKGRWSRLGVLITHASILLILAGAVAGIYLGFKGGLNLPEGASYPLAFFKRGNLSGAEKNEQDIVMNAIEDSNGDIAVASKRLNVTTENLIDRMNFLGIKHLGFVVRCDDFEVSFYGQSDMPKEYTSHLSVIDEGKVVMSKWIQVNDPLEYKGITFYQSSYGMSQNNSNLVFKLNVRFPSGQTEKMNLKLNEGFTVPGTKTYVKAVDFSPALSYDQSGKPFTYAEMMNNPAAQLEISNGKEKSLHWVLKRYPNTGVMPDGTIIELEDVWGVQYTGLQVRKDPGVWIVYLGCLLMSIGLYMAFFINHKRLWVRVSESKGHTKILVGASTNKNKVGFEEKIDRVFSTLKEGGK